MLNISEVRINIFNSNNSLKAFADITISAALVIKGFKVMETNGKLWVAMPSKIGKDDKYADQVFPITGEARQELIDTIVDAYNKKVASEGNAGVTGSSAPTSNNDGNMSGFQAIEGDDDIPF